MEIVIDFLMPDSLLGSEDNWNEWQHYSDSALANEHYCYTLHYLFDMAACSKDEDIIKKIFYISLVCCDIKVILQRDVSTSKGRGRKFVSCKLTDPSD